MSRLLSTRATIPEGSRLTSLLTCWNSRPNHLKRGVFCIAVAIASLTFTSCNRTQSVIPSNQPTTEVFSSTPPFKTLEPERYQAIRVVTFTDSTGSKEVSRTLVARDGSSRREELLGPNPTIYLYLPQGVFVLAPESGVYADSSLTSEAAPEAPSLEEPLEQPLHEGGSEALYRQLGYEELDGRRLRKYQVIVNGTDARNVTNSGTVVWIDEELGLPTRTETRAANGNNTVVELTDIRRNVDPQQFQIPQNYHKVTWAEVQQALRRK